MALYVKSGGGNWSAAGTWSATGAAGVDNAGPPTAADDCIAELASGQLTIDATSTCKSLSCTAGTGSYAGTLTHGSFTLTVAGSLTFSAGMTYTVTGSSSTAATTISATGTITSAGKVFSTFNHTGGTLTLGDNLTAGFTSGVIMTLSGTAVDLNGKTLSGSNSTSGRLFLISNLSGTPRTITMSGGTFANCDFKDIRFSSATDLDLSAITGLSGDCGGNSLIGGGSILTFTPSAPQTWNGTSGGNWSTGWVSRAPLPQDDWTIGSAFIASQTITVNMRNMGRSGTFAGVSGNPTFASSFSTTTQNMFGSLTLSANITRGTWTASFALMGRDSYMLTSAGLTMLGTSLTLDYPTGTYSLQDALTVSSAITHTSGGLISNNFTITTTSYSSSNSNVRALTLGTSNVALTSTNTITIVSLTTSSNMTLSAATSTITIVNASANLRTIAGGSLTYGTLTYTVAGSTGQMNITGSNSFAQINFSDVTNARSLLFTAATTTTIRDKNGFNVRGTAGKLMSVNSITAATHTLTSSSKQSCDYLLLTNSIAVGGPWYAGSHSTDNGGNTGWIFTDAPPDAGSSGAGSAGLQSRRNVQNLQNLQ